MWLPLFFPWLPIILWLRPRLRILTFERDNDNGRFVFQMISWIMIAAMLVLSQKYLTTATGKIQDLSSISDIDKTEKTRYYKLKNFVVAPSFGGSYTDFRSSGKHNQYLNFNSYFVTPILKDSAEVIFDTPKYWYGVKFKKQISNKISDAEKESMYKAFYADCIDEMNKLDFHSLDHFERKPTLRTERTT